VAVQGYQETIEIPTYVLGPEDPNPPFQRRGYWDVYPYTMMDDIGEKARPVKYHALVLENEYVKVIVLPELGGRLYSAQDKQTGREIFYRNNVVKPGLIALRGAWISGGIEFNFPKGHTVTSVTPVDGRLVTEEDGAVTAWVGNVEKRYRMSWAVGLRLRPESSLIETEIRLSNRTALPHPYYFWANAAVPARFGMRMIYPCTRVRTWGGHYDWPTDKGRDMATYDAYERQCDVFALNGLEDFFGVYYPDLDFGVCHVADVHDAFGKKMFTWGTSEEGRTWSGVLSDGDGPYCEMQSGRFVDQGTYRMLPPHHTLQWTEHWYAVKGTGGFAWANQEAAVRLVVENGAVDCGVLATRPFPGAKVRLLSGDKVVRKQSADLGPDQPLRLNVPKSAKWKGPLAVSVLDGSGREIIRYREAQLPRTLPLRESPKPADPPTAGDLLRQAIKAEQGGEAQEARKLYQQALEKDAACLQAKVALGRMATLARPQEAVDLLSEAAALAPESAEACYYLGIALRRAGRAEEAETELWKAAHDSAFAHAARIELGGLATSRGDWETAVEILTAADSCTVDDLRARCLLAAALRRSGLAEVALEVLATASSAGALDRLVLMETRFCALVLEKERLATQQLKALVKMLPPDADAWLELAMDYADTGMVDEARDVLQVGAEQVKVVNGSPLVHYALASWREAQGLKKEAAEHRATAKSLPLKYVFPYHWELEAILRDALAADAGDASAHSYLGLLLYAQGRREEALAEWEAAVQAGREDSYVLFRNLGWAQRDLKQDLAAAESWLRRAVGFQPDDVRPYLELNEVLRATRTSPEIRLAALDDAPWSVQRRGTIAAAQLDACIDLAQWDRALDELRTHTYHRWEGEFGMRGLWVNVNLGLGAERYDRGEHAEALESFQHALEYPKNLRIGRHARRLDARSHWCVGVGYEAVGDLESAKRHWEEAAAELPHYTGDLAHFYGTHAPDLTVYRALALQKLGRAEEAEKDLAELVARLQGETNLEEVAAKFFLGLALKTQGKKAEAEAALRQALDLYPWMPRATRLLESETIL